MANKLANKGHLSVEPELLARFKLLEAKQEKDQAERAKTAKRGRGFRTFMFGMEKAAKLHIPLYRLDLTLREYYQPKTMQYWQTLRKRIARHYGIKLNYCDIKAKGTKGGKIHLHFVYWASTLNGKPIYELSRAWINKHWLSWNWHDITGSKITFIKCVAGTAKDRHKVTNYCISQYFAGKNDYERMSYSHDWLFVGSSNLWKHYFAPNYWDSKTATLDSFLYLLVHPTDLAVIPNG